MSFVACPECDRDVSDRAPACPTCGYPMRASERFPVVGIITALSLIYAGALAAIVFRFLDRC